MRNPAHVYNAPTVTPAAMDGIEPVLLLSYHIRRFCWLVPYGGGWWWGLGGDGRG